MFLDDLNKLINNSFAYSNVNTTDLKSIDGKSLKIDLLNTNTVIFIEINNEKILLKGSPSKLDITLQDICCYFKKSTNYKKNPLQQKKNPLPQKPSPPILRFWNYCVLL